jgi:hypothetical protein
LSALPFHGKLQTADRMSNGAMTYKKYEQSSTSVPFQSVLGCSGIVGHLSIALLILGLWFVGRLVMKWAAMYLVGFVVLVGGLLAALWKLGVLQSVGTTWTLIGVAILIGIGIMISVSHSGSKENIQIDRK